MILNENTLSSNIALGRPIDMGWLNALGSDAVGWLKKGAASAWNYLTLPSLKARDSSFIQLT